MADVLVLARIVTLDHHLHSVSRTLPQNARLAIDRDKRGATANERAHPTADTHTHTHTPSQSTDEYKFDARGLHAMRWICSEDVKTQAG
jgi:hypothetical protein